MAPWIVIFGRLGLTYNLMAPFFLMSLIAIWFYFRKPSIGWLVAASTAAALAFSTDYLGILCGVTIGLALLVKRPRALGWFTLIYSGCVILAILPVLLVNAPIFFYGYAQPVYLGGGVQSTSVPLISILINYTELLRRESWILLGLCGLFLIKDDALRNLLLTAVGLTLLMVTRAYTPVGVGLHYLMHLFPIFALGLAVFMLACLRTHQRSIQWATRNTRFACFPCFHAICRNSVAQNIFPYFNRAGWPDRIHPVGLDVSQLIRHDHLWYRLHIHGK